MHIQVLLQLFNIICYFIERSKRLQHVSGRKLEIGIGSKISLAVDLNYLSKIRLKNIFEADVEAYKIRECCKLSHVNLAELSWTMNEFLFLCIKMNTSGISSVEYSIFRSYAFYSNQDGFRNNILFKRWFFFKNEFSCPTANQGFYFLLSSSTTCLLVEGSAWSGTSRMRRLVIWMRLTVDDSHGRLNDSFGSSTETILTYLVAGST